MLFKTYFSFDDSNFLKGSIEIIDTELIVYKMSLAFFFLLRLYYFLGKGTEIIRYNLSNISYYSIDQLGSKQVVRVYFKDNSYLRFKIAPYQVDQLTSYLDYSKNEAAEYNIY